MLFNMSGPGGRRRRRRRRRIMEEEKRDRRDGMEMREMVTLTFWYRNTTQNQHACSLADDGV
jgi:hypothetical protein